MPDNLVLNGNYNNGYDRIVEQVATSSGAAFYSRRHMASLNDLTKGGNIKALIDLYLRDKGKKMEATKTTDMFSLKLFVKLAGDKDVNEYLLDDFIGYRETLDQVPKGFLRKKQLKKKSLPELMQEVNEDIAAGRASRHELLDLRTLSRLYRESPWISKSDRKKFLKDGGAGRG